MVLTLNISILRLRSLHFTNNANFLTDMLKSLKEHGFSLSMDDYRTGYSNFSYMFDTPFQIIKLDKSILWSSDNNERAAIILKTRYMIQEMKLESLVEGVETEQQKKYFQSLNVTSFHQGYFIQDRLTGTSFMSTAKRII